MRLACSVQCAVFCVQRSLFLAQFAVGKGGKENHDHKDHNKEEHNNDNHNKDYKTIDILLLRLFDFW